MIRSYTTPTSSDTDISPHPHVEEPRDDDNDDIPMGPGPTTAFTDDGVVFYPTAGVQRYGAACDLLNNPQYFGENKPKKVIDLGCGELSLFKFVKHVPGINHFIGVDYDGELLLQRYKQAEPLLYDYIIKRSEPLEVEILQGDACRPDSRLLDADAVICIELVEHLDPGTLDRLPHNIFGYIQPRVALITTPNADFNVLFLNLRDGKFRHYDHRFEWSRQQFEDWANNLVTRYPNYTVQFAGIAKGPKGTEDLGCCSQSALFVRTDIEMKTEEAGGSSDVDKHDVEKCSESKTSCDLKKYQTEEESQRTEKIEEKYSFDNVNWELGLNNTPYKLIETYSYQYKVETRTEDEQLLDTAMNRIVIYKHGYRDEEDYGGDVLIPVAHLLKPRTDLQEPEKADVEHLKELLIAKNFTIRDDCLVYDSSSENDEFRDDSEGPESYTVKVQEEECWDAEPPAANSGTYWFGDDHNMDTSTSNLQPLGSSVSNEVLYDLSGSEGRGSTSPLANFFNRTGAPDEEHKLSDSGYTKSQSQDSPQSPVCSDTFSNDLITPDRDFSDMTPANILECIPENLNCLTAQMKESRRRSIGHGLNASCSPSSEFKSEHVAGRPKSLHVFRSSDDDGVVWNTPSDAKDSPIIPELSPDDDGGIFVNNLRPLDFLLINNAEDARILRPDFLDIQNLLGVQNRDRLNNNVDLEGNNVQGDENEGEVFVEEDNNIVEDILFIENDDAIFQRHLDRHNENHLIALVGANHVQEQPLVEEIVLQYEENVEDDENNEFYQRPQGAELPSPTDSSYRSENPLDSASSVTEEFAVDDLISSIEQTLSLEDPSNFDKDDIEQLRTELSDIDLKSNLYFGLANRIPSTSSAKPIFYIDSDNSLSENQPSLESDTESLKKIQSLLQSVDPDEADASEGEESASTSTSSVKFIL